jgi:hypothetical protein
MAYIYIFSIVYYPPKTQIFPEFASLNILEYNKGKASKNKIKEAQN